MFRVIDNACTNGVSTRLTDWHVSQSAIQAEGLEVGVSIVNKARWKKSEVVKMGPEKCGQFTRSISTLQYIMSDL